MKMSTKRVNRILSFALILALIVPGELAMHRDEAVSAAAAVNEVTATVTANELNVRTSPRTDGDANKLYVNGTSVRLTYGQRVTVIGESNGWYNIRFVYDGEVVEGYSKAGSEDVTWISLDGDLTETVAAEGMVTASTLNVRTGPSTDYEVITYNDNRLQLSYGKIVRILAEDEGWYRVEIPLEDRAVIGYCIMDYIEVTTPAREVVLVSANGEAGSTPAPTPTPTPAPSPVPSPVPDEPNDPSDVPEPTKAPAGEDDPDPTATPKPTKKPKATATPTPLPRVIALPFDTDPDEVEVPEPYTLVEAEFHSKFQVRGSVKAELLNLRESPSMYSDVIAELPEGTEVIIIDSEMHSERDENNKISKVRWYQVVVYAEEGYICGYVSANYVELDYSEPVAGEFIYNDTVLKEKPGSSVNVKDENGEAVEFDAGHPIEILEETISKSGIKRFLITTEKDGVEYTGYQNYQFFTFAEGETSLYVYMLCLDNGGGKYSFSGANAVIKDGYGVPLHTEPSFTSATYVTEDKKPVLLYTGDSVEITDVAIDDEIIWCYVRSYYDGEYFYGYLRSNYLDSDSELLLMSDELISGSTTLDFEAKLAAQGFPESYREKLRILHEQYPAWEFKAYHTGLDWDYVVENESGIGDNLIENYDVGIEWKSLEPGAYSWKTDTFTVFDGSSWVTVSQAGLKYYLDPRNFMDADTIFQFEVLNFSPSYQTIDGVENVLRNTTMAGSSFSYNDELGIKRTATYAETIMMAAEYSGVSPFHLASRIKQEITLGRDAVSNSVTGTVSGYEGLYNYYNIGATHSTESGGAIRNGLRFAQNGSSNADLNLSCLIPWNTKYRSIVGGAYYIGRNYINKGQNTIYLQKFNVTGTNSFWHQYMANVRAPYSEGRRLLDAYDNPEQINIVFLIPVYQNMPEEPCPAPEKQYNPNNWLKTLKIYDEDDNKLTLTPSFDYTADQQYDMIVDSSVVRIKVKTTTVSSLAEVTSKKAFKLEYGKNKIVIKVKAENGDVRKYIINVVREEPPEEPEETEDTTEDIDVSESGDGTSPDETGSDVTSSDTDGSADSASSDGSETGDAAAADGSEAGSDASPSGDGEPAGEDAGTQESGSAESAESVQDPANDDNGTGETDESDSSASHGAIYYDE